MEYLYRKNIQKIWNRKNKENQSRELCRWLRFTTQDLQDDLVQKTHFQHDLQNSSKFLQSKEGKGKKPKVFQLDTGK